MAQSITQLLLAALFCLSPFLSAQGHHIHTNRPPAKILPLPKEEGVFHFVIYGDRTGGKPEGVDILRQAVADTNLLGPDLVMTVGDLVQGYNETDAWMPQMVEYRGVMDRLDCPWFPIAGNHDIYYRGEGRPKFAHEGNYEKHFGPLWYWFEHKNCAFFALYSDEGDRKTGAKGYRKPELNHFSDKQLKWLQSELQKTKSMDHVFVFLHHPKWQARYKGSNWDRVHDLLVETGNCSAVFAGHIHQMAYDGKRDGIDYFALAVTGGNIRAEVRGQGLLHHMNLVTVRKDRITHATIAVGDVLDPRMFTPAHVDDVKAARKIQAEIISKPLVIGAKGSVDGELQLRFRNPCTRPVELTYSFDVASSAWGFGIDHDHLDLKPGESREVIVPIARKSVGLDFFRMPVISCNVDYLASTARFSLPEMRTEFRFDLGALPESVFTQFDGAQSLDGALSFDGSTSVAIASAGLKLPDGSFTVEAWMKARDLSGRRGLMTKAEASEFGLFVSEGAPGFSVHLDGKYANALGPKGRLKIDQWYHIAGVYDGDELRLYIDGKLEHRVRAAGKRTRNRLPFLVGADVDKRGGSTSGFDGWIDEVRISKVARYTAASFEPAARHKPDASTVLLLPADGLFGFFALDHSVAAGHGRVRGAVRVEASGR